MAKRKKAPTLVREARKSLGLNGESQQALLRKVRTMLHLTNEELAQALGVKLPTLMAYLSPATAAKHRKMPADSKLILERILAGHRTAKRKM